jgi:methyl-accepting chemotaxis protein
MGKVRLTTKLVGGSLVVLIVPLLALGLFSVKWSSKAINDLEKDQMVTLRKVVADQVNIMFDGQTSLLRNASTNDAVIQDIVKLAAETGVGDIAQAKLSIRTTVFHDKNTYEIFFMTDEKGKVIGDTSGGKYEKTDLSAEEYFKKAILGEFVIGKVLVSEGGGQSYIIVAGPLKWAEKGIVGVMVSGWKLNALSNKIGDLKFGKTGYAFVVDDRGMFIVHPDKGMTMKTNIRDVKGMETLAKRMLSSEDGVEECSFNGDDKIVAFAPVQAAKWSVGLAISKKELMGPIQKMRDIIALAGVFTVAIAASIILWITHKGINNPINRIVKNLNAGAEQVSSASAQISSASHMVANGASEQASGIEETSSSLEEIASMTKQNASNAEEANGLMAKVGGLITKGQEAMNRLSGAIDEIKRSSDATSKIVKTIDGIAFQTNLLALNAAVEAARAGDAGKGFAVVADEVRNLAQRASEAARNTAALIEGSVKNADQGVSVSSETAKALKEVTVSAKRVSDLISEIAAASKEQSQGIAQVATAVAQMNQVTQSTAANAEESASASEGLKAQAEQVDGIIRELMTIVGGSNAAHNGDGRVTDRGRHVMRSLRDTAAGLIRNGSRKVAVRVTPFKKEGKPENAVEDESTAYLDPKEVIAFHKGKESDEEFPKAF